MTVKNQTSDYIDFQVATAVGRKLLHTPKREKIGLYILVGINVGLRISDMMSLTWEDLRSEEICIKEEKTGKRKCVKVNEAVKAAVATFDSSFQGLVFLSQKKVPYSTVSINRLLTEYFADVCPGKNISSHSLRKTFGRYVYQISGESDKSLMLLSQLFNHESISVTRDYLGLTQQELNAVYDMISIS